MDGLRDSAPDAEAAVSHVPSASDTGDSALLGTLVYEI
jgi:hypothetical protein